MNQEVNEEELKEPCDKEQEEIKSEEKPSDEAAENASEKDTKEKESKKEKKDKQKEKIDELTKQVEILNDQLLRNRAELENFKKRMNEEKLKDRKYASLGLVSDLVVHLDNLNRVVNMPTEDTTLKNFLIGFKMINDQLFECLKQDGLEEIKAMNLDFDPSVHQAIEKVKTEGVEPNKVVQELQKGYKYKDRVIRPAMVKVSE